MNSVVLFRKQLNARTANMTVGNSNEQIEHDASVTRGCSFAKANVLEDKPPDYLSVVEASPCTAGPSYIN